MLIQWKQPYVPPAVLSQVDICLERSLLASIVDKTNPVTTAGQSVDQEIDYSNSSTFNHLWSEVEE